MDNLYIGTSGWTYDHWKGDFYPPELPFSRWFSYYCTFFNAVEINATFYRYFQDTTFLKWYENSPPGFCYVLKVPRIITHRKYMVNCSGEITEFSRQAMLLKEKLGCLLVQLPPGLRYDEQLLFSALDVFPREIRLAVEFRNKQWYKNSVLDRLFQKGIAVVLVDSPEKSLDCTLKSIFPYLRFHGRTGWYSSFYSDEELYQVAKFLSGVELTKEKPGFVFFNNDFGGFAPRNAIRLLKLAGGGN